MGGRHRGGAGIRALAAAWATRGKSPPIPRSLRLHGKFFVQELDYRTENAETWGGDAQESARHELAITFGPEEGAAQLRRDLGAALAQGGGAWHYCLMGNSWNHPEHMANIREAQTGGGDLSEMAADERACPDGGLLR